MTYPPANVDAIRVERSLYERANGYNYEATKIFMPAGSKQPVVVHYIEHCPPDVGAAFIWLKNRDPERWRDSQVVEARARQVHYQRSSDDGGRVGSRTSDSDRRDGRRGAAGTNEVNRTSLVAGFVDR
jgi:hypothetical protein